MARNEETRRVQFTLPASLVDAIDAYCEQARMSRSAFVEYTLASSVLSVDRLMNSVADSVSSAIVKEEGAGE